MMTSRAFMLLGSCILGVAGLHPSSAGADAPASPVNAGYSVVARWPVGGDGRWDCLAVDAPGHRLFIAHQDSVEVLDTTSGQVIGAVPHTQGVNVIALAPELGRGFASNGHSHTLTVFDLSSLAVLREMAVPGREPDGLAYEPRSKRVFVFNGESKTAVVYDAATLAVLANLKMPAKPELAVEDGEGHVFVNMESEAGQLLKLDGANLKVQGLWPLPDCAYPTGIAADRVHHRIFSVCDEKTMAVTDARTGKALATVPIGEGPDGAGYDAARGLVFSSNGEGSLTIVRQEPNDRYAVVGTLATQKGARTMALDPTNGRIYLVTADLLPPPAPTAAVPEPRPRPAPGTFVVLVVAPGP